MNRFTVALALLLGLISASAQTNTNLDLWAQNLNLALTAITNGVPVTNGIIAKTRTSAVRIGSKDIIGALNNKPVQAIAKMITNFTVVVTNHVPGPDILVTNTVTEAVPAFATVVPPAFSPSARLLLLDVLGTNGFGPLPVIRDGQPPADYAITNYFQVRNVSFDGRTNAAVVTGRFDVFHNLEAVTETSVKEFLFNPNGFTNAPPTVYFDVQGLATERRSGLTQRTNVIDRGVSKGLSVNVAGTGQIGSTNGFAIVRGTVTANGGKHEVR